MEIFIILAILTVPLLMTVIWWDKLVERVRMVGGFFKATYSNFKTKIKTAIVENKRVAKYLAARQDRIDLKRFQSEFSKEDWDGIAKQLFQNELRMLSKAPANYGSTKTSREFILRTTCEVVKGLCVINKIFPVIPAVAPVGMVKHSGRGEADTFEVYTENICAPYLQNTPDSIFTETAKAVAGEILISYLVDIFENLSVGKNRYDLELSDIMQIITNADSGDLQVLRNKIGNISNYYPSHTTKMLITTPEVLSALQCSRNSEFNDDRSHDIYLESMSGVLSYCGKLDNIEVWCSSYLESSFIVYNDREVICDDGKPTVNASISLHPYMPVITLQPVIDQDAYEPRTPVITRRAIMPHKINGVDHWSNLDVTFAEPEEEVDDQETEDK